MRILSLHLFLPMLLILADWERQDSSTLQEGGTNQTTVLESLEQGVPLIAADRDEMENQNSRLGFKYFGRDQGRSFTPLKRRMGRVLELFPGTAAGPVQQAVTRLCPPPVLAAQRNL